MSHSKRFNELKAMVDPKKTYSIEEAFALACKTSNTKFDSSIEVHVRLGVDPKKGDQQVRANVSLPNGLGKTKRVAVFVGNAEKEKEAKDAGATLVGGEELIAQIISTGKIDFDVAVATPDMMPKLAKVARILGPKGLMPSPKNETVTPNIKKAVEELMKGRVVVKVDDTANVHQAIGKASFGPAKLIENYTVLMDALRRAKPATSKGVYLISTTISSSMGPGISIA